MSSSMADSFHFLFILFRNCSRTSIPRKLLQPSCVHKADNDSSSCRRSKRSLSTPMVISLCGALCLIVLCVQLCSWFIQILKERKKWRRAQQLSCVRRMEAGEKWKQYSSRKNDSFECHFNGSSQSDSFVSPLYVGRNKATPFEANGLVEKGKLNIKERKEVFKEWTRANLLPGFVSVFDFFQRLKISKTTKKKWFLKIFCLFFVVTNNFCEFYKNLEFIFFHWILT